jgi:hypothetical protein
MIGAEEARDAAFAAVRDQLVAREALVDLVRDGQRRAVDVVGDASGVARSTRLLVVLEAEPGAQKVQTRRRLAALGVSEMAVIGELSPQQRESIVRSFGTSAGTGR